MKYPGLTEAILRNSSWRPVKAAIRTYLAGHFDHQLEPGSGLRILRFSGAPENQGGDGGICNSTSEPLLERLFLRYWFNKAFMEDILARQPHESAEGAAIDQLRADLPVRLEDGLINLSIGRHYDVYLVNNSVIKVERFYCAAPFPGYETQAGQWETIESSLTPLQEEVWQQIKAVPHARAAVFRSITTQQFYARTIQGRLKANEHAETHFALMQVGNLLLDVQFQPWHSGPTLMQMLEDNPPWKMCLGAPGIGLKRAYRNYTSLLKSQTLRFVAVESIDHHPSNFVFDETAHQLTLVDIQEFIPAYDKPNRDLLERNVNAWKPAARRKALKPEAISPSLLPIYEHPTFSAVLLFILMFTEIVALRAAPFDQKLTLGVTVLLEAYLFVKCLQWRKRP